MGQSNPSHLGKIEKNIKDLKDVLKGDDTLLDAGCYWGDLFGYLKHPKYHGIDIVQANIDEARRVYLDHRGCTFERKDILELEGSWDVIFCSRVLMHIPPWEEAIKRMLACAKKYLVLVVPLGGYNCSVEMHGGEPVYFQRFSPSQFDGFGKCTLHKYHRYSTVIFEK